MSDLKTLADEFLGAKNPPFAEAHPTECRELLHAFAEYLENTPIQLSRSVTASFGKPAGELLSLIPGPDASVGSPGDIRAIGEDHPHRVESHTLDDIDEDFRKS